MKVSVKSVICSNNWIITKIMQGKNGQVRIDAKRRYPVADESSFFSQWVKKTYADRLTIDQYGKKTNDFAYFEY